ncbi:putative protein phosphatase 2C 63-like [Capsicum annuum]|uniref:probable E3 ubiquitin-protein ligase RHY1A n=1 Tax=Capsicum annuum TaxID=4072 RepID=UPI0007BEEEB2|nr:probable E3 ubiquitin-protein ligase RHY1A [Capsicum annuum]KAF3668399.1 putative protein phosphatase 2C 63-like [Capsicum annuum]KAF3685472.1 putative protein phosphatase 2C 63-like [Capsicum annuum]
MTSASELFFTRRSRYGRSDLELGSNLSPSRISHHHGGHNRRHHHQNIRRDRLDVNDCEPLRRSPHLHRRFPPPPDRDSVSLDSGSSQAASGGASHATNHGNRIRDRVGIAGSERLPGSVLLARERLLQRLRGVSISGNRGSYRVPVSSRHNFTFEDDFRLADVGDWESDSSLWTAGTTPSPDLMWVDGNKRPPGLSQEAMNLLHIGIFSNSDKKEEETQARVVLDCSICLDAFLEGDKLVCLPCGHRFHPCCLEPWVRTCGDCPYCRAAIHVTSCRAKGRP